METRLGFGWTPLMCAVHVAHYELAELLLDHSASANFSRGKWRLKCQETLIIPLICELELHIFLHVLSPLLLALNKYLVIISSLET